jgi:hypothetical protein
LKDIRSWFGFLCSNGNGGNTSKISTGAKLVDAIIEGVLSQDKAFLEGIVVLLLKKITQYRLKRPKKIVTTNFDPVLVAPILSCVAKHK